MELAKGDFAREMNLSPGRISQMIKEGIIGPDAITPAGRIVVELAKAQIAARRHVGQALGNGLGTNIVGAPAVPPGQPAPLLGEKQAAELIQLERLEQERRKNRQAEKEEAIANGQLVRGDELVRQVAKATQRVVNEFTGMAPDIANAIAAKWELPQRDVLHLVRQVMRAKRGELAAAARREGEALPETAEALVA